MRTPSQLPPSSSRPLLQIKNLTVDLPPGADRQHALKDVSLTINSGEILCVVGESGSGKSLTAGAILGLLPQDVRASAGQILWQGEQDLLRLPAEAMRRLRGQGIGMIFQEPMTALNPLRTIGDQIAEVFRTHTRLGRADIRERTLALLESVRLPEPAQALEAYPHELSGGQRQRAMIAMALALEPALLIADEPTTALDVTTQAQILHLIHDLQRRKGTAVLFITHDFGVVAEIADRVAVMQRGVLVENGTAEQVLEHPRHPYTCALIAAVPPLEPAAARAGSFDDAPVILSTDALSKTYRKRGWLGRAGRVTHAVDGVSITLREGGTLGIVGESGSGKSTLARTLLGLVPPDAGAITLAGKPLVFKGGSAHRDHARRVQMVFQDPYGSLNPRQRVGEIVAQGPMVHGTPRREAMARAAELFELVGLSADAIRRYPHEFSGGQRQRVGLARALAMQPRVLIADEPVSALDVSVQAQVLALLARLRDQLGLSIVFITHDLRVAAQVCDHIAVMKSGRVVESGVCADVFRQPAHPYTQALLAAVPGKKWNPAEVALRLAA
ncbi:ABC transporter ATP-binding protein [Achromobacter kerstersii]|uniref:Glutathione import ATP-binding protein GsiA n=1 Tax=Achromobacter kerstersii TaxID=1353890 RepID=A0A6S6Z8D6_9BURK|nr:ABC transporter ATP-binding protein [Achromobacter kerstersii]CAB3667408.1 Glutathione import ATP-binding protein GsiA [Achromobacter kerstersii]